MEVLKKISQAKFLIKSSDIKKGGRNDFSKYDYFTPEQIDKLVADTCHELNIFNKYDLKRTNLGMIAVLTITDIESGKSLEYEMAMEIPEIKATNITQQLGGAMTYSKRYLLMSAYDIVDNNLDPDADKKPSKETPTQPKDPKDEMKWLNKWTNKDKTAVKDEYTATLKWAKEKGHTALDLKKFYKISNPTLEELKNDMI